MRDETPSQRLAVGLAHLHLTLTASQQTALLDYLALLARWNRAYNLTGVREPLAMVGQHLLDSLAALPWLSSGPVLDLGTGAGLPGLPLAIARPDLAFVLLDSVGKKTRFVQEAVFRLGLDNVRVVQARATAYRPEQRFTTVLVRAVARLEMCWADSAHLRAERGRLLGFKGAIPTDEIAAVRATGAAVTIHPLQVPFVTGARHLLEVTAAGMAP